MALNTISKLPIPRSKYPSWLKKAENLPYFPIREILKDSLYYPNCDLDGLPVKNFNKYVYSFVYVDYWVSIDKVKAEMESNGFAGYSNCYSRIIAREELYKTEEEFQIFNDNLCKYAEERRNKFQHDNNITVDSDNYAFWTVWERDGNLTSVYGPKRFSFLYIRDDSLITYINLYYFWHLVPEVFALVNPGGYSWINLSCANKIIHPILINHPVGIPPNLLFGYNNNINEPMKSFWNGYSGPVCEFGYDRRLKTGLFLLTKKPAKMEFTVSQTGPEEKPKTKYYYNNQYYSEYKFMQPPLPNAYWIYGNRIIMVGDNPADVNVETTKHIISALLNEGVKCFINLTRPEEKDANGNPIPDYEEVLERLAVEKNHKVIIKRFPITKNSVPPESKMIKILNAIDKNMEKNIRTYIHSQDGTGRTGLAIGCWLQRNHIVNEDNVFPYIQALRWNTTNASQPSPETHKQKEMVWGWNVLDRLYANT